MSFALQPVPYRYYRHRALAFVAALLIAVIPLTAAAQRAPAGPQASDEEIDQASRPGTTEINLKNAEIAAIIRIFSKKTGRNYILDENVKGKVTIYLPGKVSGNEAVRILDSILALKGFTSVPVSENLWKIIPAKDAKQTTIPLKTGDDAGDGQPTAAVVTRIVPLKFVSVDDMKQLLSPLVSPEGLVNAYTGTNSLILIDSEDNIHRIVSIISELDVPSSDRDMTIIPVKNAEAKAIADKLNEILGAPVSGQQGGSGGSEDLLRARNIPAEQQLRPGQPPRPQGSVDAVNLGGKTITARSREPKITADERTNSVIVVADEDTTARIQALIAQLDSKVDLSGAKFYVYRCQHASAQELVDVLGGLGSGGGTGSRSSASRTTNDGFGGTDTGNSGFGSNRTTNGRTSSRFGTQDRMSRQSRQPGRSRNEGRERTSSGAVNLGDDISITADPATNSLIIFAGKSDYDRIMALLKELDIKRRQVLVEAVLLEVGVDESQQLGLSFLTSTGGADGGVLFNNGNILSTLTNPAAIQNFAAAAASAGTLTLPNGTTAPTQAALLTAVQGNQDVNVLSAPTILTTDNEEAEIVVGQNVPFLASTSTSDTNLNNTFNQIDRQDVGITLRLTPQISSGEFVTLKIFTEVSNVVGDTANSTLGPTTTVRTSDTTVITKDSQLVVTGGLMSDNISSTESGVPFLMDVPVLGHLFKQSGDRHQKTNLLILITPRIIKDQYDHREVTIAARDDVDSEMAALKSYPNRAEVLHDERIDKVSEAKPWDGPKPGTILPPLTSGGNQRITLDSSSLSGEDTIQLKVSPKLPAGAAGKIPQPPAARLPDSDAALSTKGSPSGPALPAAAVGSSSGGTVNNAVVDSGSRYVVLEVKKGQKVPRSVPFGGAVKSGLIALTIGPDTPASAREFFSAGERYTYQAEGGDLLLTVVGVYSDSDSAQRLHKRLPGQWYALSPYEIMNLGSGPWVATK